MCRGGSGVSVAPGVEAQRRSVTSCTRTGPLSDVIWTVAHWILRRPFARQVDAKLWTGCAPSSGEWRYSIGRLTPMSSPTQTFAPPPKPWAVAPTRSWALTGGSAISAQNVRSTRCSQPARVCIGRRRIRSGSTVRAKSNLVIEKSTEHRRGGGPSPVCPVRSVTHVRVQRCHLCARLHRLRGQKAQARAAGDGPSARQALRTIDGGAGATEGVLVRRRGLGLSGVGREGGTLRTAQSSTNGYTAEPTGTRSL